MKLPPFLCPLGYDRNGGFYMKYTLKEKLRFVKLHIEENVPIYEIERKYGFRADALKYFCRLYKVHGEKAFQKEENTRQPLFCAPLHTSNNGNCTPYPFNNID